MTDTARLGDRFEIGRVIQRAFGAIGHNAATFAVLAVVLAGVPALISTIGLVGLVGLLGGMAKLGSPHVPALWLRALAPDAMLTSAGGLIGLVSNAVLQGAVIYGTASYLNGRPASLGECFGAGVRRCLPLIGLMLLTIIAVMFGFMLFFVPGIMMAVAWIAAAPALVVERTGVFAAFGRSADLTRGRRWPIFGLIFIYFVVISVVQQVLINLVGVAFATTTPQLAMLNRLPVSAVVGVFVSVLASAGVASIYYELRSTREGIGPEALASVFD